MNIAFENSFIILFAVLFAGDVNFASDLSDLRHRKKFEVVLIHKSQVSDALLSCSTEHFLYEDLIWDLPLSAGQRVCQHKYPFSNYVYICDVSPPLMSLMFEWNEDVARCGIIIHLSSILMSLKLFDQHSSNKGLDRSAQGIGECSSTAGRACDSW